MIKNKCIRKQFEKKIMWFCNFPGHTAFSCFIKNNIALIIDGDEFVELLQDTCLTKVIDSD